MKELSPIAERVLVLEYIRVKGFPPSFEGDAGPDVQYKVVGRVLGISAYEVAAAYAELEDKKLVDRKEGGVT